jgi:hypothetical protein
MRAVTFLIMVLTGLQPAISQETAGTIQGRVTHALTAEGIPEATIEVCALSSERPYAAAFDPFNGRLPSRDKVAEIRISTATATVEAKDKTGDIVFSSAPDCKIQRSVVTDNQGRFTIKDLPFQKYELNARREGHVTPLTADASSVPSNPNATLYSGKPNAEVSFSLVRSATIGGQIFNEMGRSMSNVRVRAVRKSGIAAGPTIIARESDDRGQYRLFGLPPGEYFIVASAGKAEQGVAPVDHFYRDAASIANATSITVRESEEILKIDFILRAR